MAEKQREYTPEEDKALDSRIESDYELKKAGGGYSSGHFGITEKQKKEIYKEEEIPKESLSQSTWGEFKKWLNSPLIIDNTGGGYEVWQKRHDEKLNQRVDTDYELKAGGAHYEQGHFSITPDQRKEVRKEMNIDLKDGRFRKEAEDQLIMLYAYHMQKHWFANPEDPMMQELRFNNLFDNMPGFREDSKKREDAVFQQLLDMAGIEVPHSADEREDAKLKKALYATLHDRFQKDNKGNFIHDQDHNLVHTEAYKKILDHAVEYLKTQPLLTRQQISEKIRDERGKAEQGEVTDKGAVIFQLHWLMEIQWRNTEGLAEAMPFFTGEEGTQRLGQLLDICGIAHPSTDAQKKELYDKLFDPEKSDEKFISQVSKKITQYLKKVKDQGFE